MAVGYTLSLPLSLPPPAATVVVDCGLWTVDCGLGTVDSGVHLAFISVHYRFQLGTSSSGLWTLLLDFWICNRANSMFTIPRRMTFYEKLKFDANGLIPAIVQEQKTGRVLMMAWMNRASLEKTIETGKTHFWSRSRQKFWMKGESSGHTQSVKDIAFDCDGDTLLIQVEQIGAACHEGYQSCFFRSIQKGGSEFKITERQLETPEQIYGKK